MAKTKKKLTQEDFILERHINRRELATILFALRRVQESGDLESDWLVDFPHFTDFAPLTSTEVDDLCESLNCGD